MNSNEETETEGINILAKRVYIDKLEIDIIDKLEKFWFKGLDFMIDTWKKIFGIDILEEDKE